MNHALLERSSRLQRVLELLRCGEEFSTREIMLKANVCAVNSCIAELRENSFQIRCRLKVTIGGTRLYLYRLEE